MDSDVHSPVPTTSVITGKTHTDRKRAALWDGYVGEMTAVHWYASRGFEVAKTLFDSSSIDLFVRQDGRLRSVQVKTTSTRSKGMGKDVIEIRDVGNPYEYDDLFVAVVDLERCFRFPSVAVRDVFHLYIGAFNAGVLTPARLHSYGNLPTTAFEVEWP